MPFILPGKISIFKNSFRIGGHGWTTAYRSKTDAVLLPKYTEGNSRIKQRLVVVFVFHIFQNVHWTKSHFHWNESALGQQFFYRNWSLNLLYAKRWQETDSNSYLNTAWIQLKFGWLCIIIYWAVSTPLAYY